VAQYSLNAQLNKCMFRSCKHSCFLHLITFILTLQKKWDGGSQLQGRSIALGAAWKKLPAKINF